MDENKNGVQGDSPNPPKPAGQVEKPNGSGNDKDKNFAELRKKNEDLERENEELRQKLGGNSTERTLVVEDGDEAPKGKKEVATDATKVIFDRDMKKAVRKWNTKNKVSKEEWATIQNSVHLRGDEDDEEIYEKIDASYNSLPSVKQKREKELIDQGRNEAMRELSDEELDMGVGGGDSTAPGAGQAQPRFNQKTRSFVKGLGMSQKELNEVDPNGDPRKEKILDPKYQDR